MPRFAALMIRLAASSIMLLGIAFAASAAEFSQAPSLDLETRAGALPPVAERLPEVPLLIQPVSRPGVYGGEWRMGMRGDRDHALIIRTMGYENLVRWNPAWTRVIPNIALAVTPNKDYTRYRFHLRKGMRWSDGAPFTAEDILFWAEDVLGDPALTKAPPSWLVSGGETVRVTMVDEHTVDFHFASPYGLFLRHLAHPLGAEPTSYPKHYLARFHPRHNPHAQAEAEAEGFAHWSERFVSKCGAIGNYDDPSRFRNPELPRLWAWLLDEGYTGGAATLTARRNPYFWKIDPMGRQLPYIDTIRFTVGDQAALIEMAKAGRIDMQNRHIADEGLRQELEAHMEQGGYHLFRTLPSRSSTYVICLNMTHKDPVLRRVFGDLRFRKALSIGIDRQAFIKDGNGKRTPYQAAPRPESPYYRERLATQYLEYDPAAANALLDAMALTRDPGEGANGVRRLPDGRPLRFDVQCQPAYAFLLEPIVAGWRALGVDARVETVSRDAEYAAKDANEHDAQFVGGEGGLDVLLENQFYLPVSTESIFGMGWMYWRMDPEHPLAMEPPAPVLQQFEYHDDLKATGDPEVQLRLMDDILAIAEAQFYAIAEAQFYAIGLFMDKSGFGVVKNTFHNVPSIMPYGWSYPTPAPTNPSQYFVEE